jgi:Methane/Phenol/Toluene Hydroxylase
MVTIWQRQVESSGRPVPWTLLPSMVRPSHTILERQRGGECHQLRPRPITSLAPELSCGAGVRQRVIDVIDRPCGVHQQQEIVGGRDHPVLRGRHLCDWPVRRRRRGRVDHNRSSTSPGVRDPGCPKEEAGVRGGQIEAHRQLAEELLVERDWGKSLVALDVADQLLYPLLYTYLDEAALNGGACSYSLIAQHLSKWFKDQRRWLDALYRAWTSDPELGETNKVLLAETNKVLLAEIVESALVSAQGAAGAVAARADQLVTTGCPAAVTESAANIREFFQALGVPMKEDQP